MCDLLSARISGRASVCMLVRRGCMHLAIFWLESWVEGTAQSTEETRNLTRDSSKRIRRKPGSMISLC